jgi:hypothetical protein
MTLVLIKICLYEIHSIQWKEPMLSKYLFEQVRIDGFGSQVH